MILHQLGKKYFALFHPLQLLDNKPVNSKGIY